MAEWTKVAEEGDLKEGSLLAAKADGESICLARLDGNVYAFEDRCSHEDFPLSAGNLEDGLLECTLHGARFDLETGQARALPAIKPVKTYEVEIRNGGVWVKNGE